jgi:ubiquinone/menaquinone biosynthesis C-methylase UbiE
MENDFNRIARIYDLGVRLVFGQKLNKATTHFLNQIKSKDQVLIVGGGSGSILKYLPKDCDIYYVDQSDAMISMSKKIRNNKVSYSAVDFRYYNGARKYDWIIFPFFLDLFEDSAILEMLDKAKSLISKNGKWIITDFANTSKIRHQLLLKMIINGITPLVNLKIKKLADINQLVLGQDMVQLASKTWGNGFIFSTIYTTGKP